MTRAIIQLRKDVAPNYWRQPWPEVVAAAEAAVDGVVLTQQPTDKGGIPMLSWTERKDGVDTVVQVAPKGWAAFYRATERGHDDVLFLHVQNLLAMTTFLHGLSLGMGFAVGMIVIVGLGIYLIAAFAKGSKA